MIEKLFVYGTLGPGRPNEHVLGAIGGSWESATVSGSLREEGWGAEMVQPSCLRIVFKVPLDQPPMCTIELASDIQIQRSPVDILALERQADSAMLKKVRIKPQV